jgi:membrane protein implicated in regulation of membrane protease activity
MAALVWFLLGAALIIAEVVSGDFVLVMLGVAALAAALAHQLGDNPAIDVATFVVVAAGLVLGVRPALKRRLQAGGHSKTGVEALKGAKATVVSTVDEHGGRVKIGGEVWSARTYEPAQTFEPGRQVIVMDIAGATAVVWAEN